jgi:hypothetical protein
MEYAIIGIAILALILASKFVQWILSAAGSLLLPLIITAIVWFVIHSHCCARTCAIVLGITFVVSLLSTGKK